MSLNANSDPTTHPISGFAVTAMDQGLDGDFSCPLISHIEGNLWTGGCIDGVRLPDEFRYVHSLYPWEKYLLDEDTRRVEIEMRDSLDQALDQVDQIAQEVVDTCRLGRTLVHCQAGLNRSGLIAGRALILQGRSADEAIRLLREKRSPMVLCNKSFEDWLRA